MSEFKIKSYFLYVLINRRFLMAMLLGLPLSSSCTVDKQDLLEKISKSSHIVVSYSNLVTGKSRELIHIITIEGDRIKIIEYFNHNLIARSELSLEWCRAKTIPRVSIVGAAFYKDDTFCGYLGVGKNKTSYFLEYYDQSGTKYSCISVEQKKEFINLLKLPKDKLEYVEQRFSKD